MVDAEEGQEEVRPEELTAATKLLSARDCGLWEAMGQVSVECMLLKFRSRSSTLVRHIGHDVVTGLRWSATHQQRDSCPRKCYYNHSRSLIVVFDPVVESLKAPSLSSHPPSREDPMLNFATETESIK
ncbi:hypothetical protein CLCR_11012 [Cladophialophora carrionii]|uniref:Uncharacterized protein n=1 Tax=Cladophialophora carrionii TaxID=86049 RepID=A0A1C1CWM8_9EURO|nr:hypothetical protein CLCR_11012 [Cladophialophora carrionii]